jgi:hypothetical protein
MTFHFCNRILIAGAILSLCCGVASGQLPASAKAENQSLSWVMQDSGTTAGLRGIDSVDGKLAWASGTGGTVLRTVDGGDHWMKCAIPGPDGETLDFRGVQARDASTAIVMASGPGDKSRLYKTIDGCKSWTLVFANPDRDGFWDAISMNSPSQDALGRPLDHSHGWGYLLGDPVNGIFSLFSTNDGGDTWSRVIAGKGGPKGEGCKVDAFAARHDEALFAASNGSLLSLSGPYLILVTGGSFSRIGYTDLFSLDGALCHLSAHLRMLPIAHGNASSGAFAIAAYPGLPKGANFPDKVMVVGGDYKLSNATSHNAAFGTRVGTFMQTFREPTTPPHGYRSSVAWSDELKAWITVGTNGSDISRDDGKTWQPMDDGNWNALSLPFVVGPKGRIARLAVGTK